MIHACPLKRKMELATPNLNVKKEKESVADLALKAMEFAAFVS